MSVVSSSKVRGAVRLLRVALVLSMLLAMLSPTLSAVPALADNANLGGDIVVNGGSNNLSFGANLCANTTVIKNILVGVSRQGNGNVYANGAQVNVTVTNLTGTGFSAPGIAGIITLPPNWTTQSNGSQSSKVPVPVTFHAGGPASYTGSLTITLTGAKDGGGTVTLTANVSLSATVINCDTTAPTLNLPQNITGEATGPSGAIVTYTATATDANPPNPAVTCTPASGSTFAIGTTTVNCSATDAAGNTANGSFNVTVRDTTGPVISGTPSNMTVPAVNASGATVNYANPTAVDAVDGPRPVTCSRPSGSTFPLGQTTVTCSATDSRNNTSTSTFVIDVKDQAAPVLQLPGSISAEATGPTGAIVTYSASATDNVDGPRPVTCSRPSGSTFPLGTTTVTCSATDSAGNTNSGSFFVTVDDTTAPVITVPAPITAEAANGGGAPVNYSASAGDLVDGAVAPSCSPASGSVFGIGTTTVSCSAVDAHGNTSSNSFTVTVRDTTPPVLHLPADQTLEATSADGAFATFAVSAQDSVDGQVNVNCSAVPGTFPIGTTTVNCFAIDSHGNRVQGSFIIKVQDTIAPQLTLPANITREATGPTGAQVLYEVSASDAAADVTPSCSPASGATFALGTTTVNCSAIDGHGNTSTGSFSVSVVDTTGPDIATSLTGFDARETAGGAYVSYNTPGANDIVDGSIAALTCTPASGSYLALGTHTITCSAHDAHNNASTQTYEILVQDANAPVLALPGNITQEATGASGAVVHFTASADDVVSGPIVPTCGPASGATFPIGTTTVRCSATDPGGNTATGTFSVIVEDTTAPVLSLPSPITAEATGPQGALVSFTTAASDTVDGARPVTCDWASGARFALGTTTVSCSSVDSHGNTAQDTFTVEVQDTTAPLLTLPSDITAEADSTSGASVEYATPSAHDLVDGAVSISCSAASGSVFEPGSTTVQCSTTDAHGNTATGAFHVSVVDTTPPALTLPANITEEATGPDGAAVGYETQAYDILDGYVVVSCSNPSGNTFPLGTITVACSATDAHGNHASSTFTITVRDTTAPDINGELTDLTAEASSGSGAIVSYTSPSAHDLVDGDLPVNCTPASGTTFALGTHTVSCSATDSYQNRSTRTFTVKVQDTTAPVLSLPQNITEEAIAASGAPVLYTVSANDIVDGPVTPNCNPASGSTFVLGNTSVNCSAADRQGNTATGSFGVTVRDTTPPVLHMPGNKTAEATGPSGAAVSYNAPTASDLVDGSVTPVCDRASGSTFGLGQNTLTCTAIDAHGNSASDTFVIDVQDNTPPSLTQPANITVEATGTGGAPVTFTAPTATDLVDGNNAVTCVPASGTEFTAGEHTVTCSASDAHGNTASVNFTVNVVDTTPPALTLSPNQTIEATGPDGAQATFEASALDILDGVVTPGCNQTSGAIFLLGTTTITCSATDVHGNTSTASTHITVRDTTAPAILGTLANINAEATGGSGAAITYSAPTAEDIVDGQVPVTCTPASGTTFPLGTNTVTCSATDANHNTATRTFTVDVQDTTAPVLSLPSNITAEATSPSGASVSYLATANDIVDGPVTPGCSPASGSTFGLGPRTVYCSATDRQGNTNSGNFTVTVVDTTPPTLTQVSNKVAEAANAAGATVTFTAPTATDIVDGSRPVTCSRVSGSTFPIGTTTVTCSAADTRNNSASTSFDVTVQDSTGPAVVVPNDITATATTAGGAILNYTASANDTVDGVITPRCMPASGSLFGPGTTTVSCSATDAHGNTTTRTFHVTVTFSWSGLLQPINTDGSSIFKLGSTVPVKFALTGASANIANLAARLYVRNINGAVQGTEQEAISTSAANTGNLFRYDPTARQYIFNLGTKGLTSGTWQLRIDVGDGRTNTVNISLRP